MKEIKNEIKYIPYHDDGYSIMNIYFDDDIKQIMKSTIEVLLNETSLTKKLRAKLAKNIIEAQQNLELPNLQLSMEIIDNYLTKEWE